MVYTVYINSPARSDVAPDGRVLMHRDAAATRDEVTKPTMVIVQHWFDELKARVPTARRQD